MGIHQKQFGDIVMGSFSVEKGQTPLSFLQSFDIVAQKLGDTLAPEFKSIYSQLPSNWRNLDEKSLEALKEKVQTELLNAVDREVEQNNKGDKKMTDNKNKPLNNLAEVKPIGDLMAESKLITPEQQKQISDITNVKNVNENYTQFKGKYFGEIAAEVLHKTSPILNDILRVQSFQITSAAIKDANYLINNGNLQLASFQKPTYLSVGAVHPQITNPSIEDGMSSIAIISKNIVLTAAQISDKLQSKPAKQDFKDGLKNDMLGSLEKLEKLQEYIASGGKDHEKQVGKHYQEWIAQAQRTLVTLTEMNKNQLDINTVKEYLDNRTAEIKTSVEAILAKKSVKVDKEQTKDVSKQTETPALETDNSLAQQGFAIKESIETQSRKIPSKPLEFFKKVILQLPEKAPTTLVPTEVKELVTAHSLSQRRQK